MTDRPLAAISPLEPTFDRTPAPFGAGLPDPLVYDASPRALRQRTVNFAAKRLTDMRYVSGLDRATAERHFRWRPAVAAGRARRFRDSARRRRRSSPTAQAPRRHRRRRWTMPTAASPSAGTTRTSASRLSAPRSRGPAMAGSSSGRTRACNSTRSRCPRQRRSPGAPGRSAMRSRRRRPPPADVAGRSMRSSPLDRRLRRAGRAPPSASCANATANSARPTGSPRAGR